MLINKEAIQKLIGENHFYISFFKKNGELRHLYGQLGIHTKLKGTNRKQYSGNEYILAYDHINRGYRYVNVKKIYKIQTGKCVLIDSEMTKIFEQDRAYQGEYSEKSMSDYIMKTVLKNMNTESEVVNGARSIRISEK
jgi:hypothetical protein